MQYGSKALLSLLVSLIRVLSTGDSLLSCPPRCRQHRTTLPVRPSWSRVCGPASSRVCQPVKSRLRPRPT